MKPKPMVEIGGRPILLHIMEIYARFGFKGFVIACGYKSAYIKDFFNNFHLNNSDFTISLRNGERTIVNPVAEDWKVSVVDTGIETMTAGRLRKLRSWIGDDTFMLTYGDGLADVDLMAFKHDGFWHLMDTVRDRKILEDIWAQDDAPWQPGERDPHRSDHREQVEASVGLLLRASLR